MASKIPTYQRTESMEAPMNVARATTAVQAASPIGNALQNIGAQGASLAGALASEQQKSLENRGAVEVSNILSQADVYWQENMAERMKAYKVGDPDMREKLGQDFDTWASENAQKLPTEKSRQYFQTHANSMKSKLQQGAFTYQERATTAKLNADSAVGEQADENVVFHDPTRFDEVAARRLEPLIARTDLDEATKIKMAQQYKTRLSMAVERGELERDPATWYKKRFGAFDPGVGGQGAAARPPAMPEGWSNTGGTPTSVPGMVESGNIDLTQRPSVKNADGSVSTVRSMGVNIDGVEVLIPTVVNGKVVSEDEAIAEYERTGKHLGKFATPAASSGYAEALHKQQEGMYTKRTPDVTTGSKAVADAIYGQESSYGKADTSTVNSQNVTGPMQIQQGTFEGMKRLGIIPQDYDWKNPEQNKDAGYKWVEHLGKKYNGDPAKVAAAYYGGEGAVNSDGTINRHWRNKQRPSDPTVGEYVDQVLGRISKNQRMPVVATVASAGNTPVGTGEKPEQPKTYSGMDWEQQLQLKNLAETRLKQGEATFKAEAERTVKDAVAMHNDGIVDQFNLSRDFFSRAYGADGARVYEEYQKSREMGADIGRFKTQSSAEIQAELNASKPAQGVGYAAEDGRYQTRMRAAAQVMEARKKDPAGYATTNSETLSAQRQSIDAMPPNDANRPAAVQQYVRDNLAEQRRLGIESPQILTPGQADRIADAASKAVRPEDSANLIAGLEAEYGTEFFPQVFSQLVRDGKISGELLVIPNLPSQAARESVSRLSRIKETDLSSGIDAAAQKQVKDAVTEKLGDFVRAIPFGTAQATGVTNSYETIMRKRAYELVQGGMKPNDAVEQAHAMVLGHYEFDGATRFPKTTNIRAAKAGAAYVLEKKIGDIDLPPDLTNSRDPEQVRAEWTRTVQSRPMWHTRDDDGGLELYAMGNNGTKYRVTRGGQPVSYSWAELATQNTAAENDMMNAGQGARARMRAVNEQRRQRIEATRQQVDNEIGMN